MASYDSKENKVARFDLKSFFYDQDIEFLVRNNGDQVHVSYLDGKTVGIYLFSPNPSCWRSRNFNPKLVEIYNELASKGEDFEIVAASRDRGWKREFDKCFSKMPWLAIPLFESEAIDYLFYLFDVYNPWLAILDGNGKIVNKDCVALLREYGIEAYPFTANKLKPLMEKKQRQPFLQRILGTASCDFLIASEGSKVPVSVLEGKIIGLYYSCCKVELDCDDSLRLREVYRELKERGKNFEIVLVCLDDIAVSFDRCFKGMPWLATPIAFKGNLYERLRWQEFPAYADYAKIRGILQIIDTDGKILNKDAKNDVVTADIEEFPFYGRFCKLGKEMTAEMESRSLESLLVKEERDYVIRNDGTTVKISNLEGKVVAFYWSASHIPESQIHTPKLVDAYREFPFKGIDFEIVYVSCDQDEDSFIENLSKMPWLAIPYFDVKTRVDLRKIIVGKRIPQLVIRDRSGKLYPEEAFWALRNNSSKTCPFTTGTLDQFMKEEQAAKQLSIKSLLGTHCDFLISNKGDRVPLSELQGKTIGLYYIKSFFECHRFSGMLKEMYGKLKKREEKFEIVMIWMDDDESSFDSVFATMPWLAAPFEDSDAVLFPFFEKFKFVPPSGLVVFGSDGKIINPNAKEVVEDYGDEAYPFSTEKIEELGEKYKPNTKPETLLVSWQHDYVIGKGGIKIPVSELAGKTIILYFGSTGTDYFLPHLRDTYFKLKEMKAALEVIFIWYDLDDEEVDEKLVAHIFSAMPWLALPYEDARIDILNRKFRREYVVAIPPSGRAVTKSDRLSRLISTFGADAYPFTKKHFRVLEKRVEELQKQIHEMAKKMPKRIKHPLHLEHELWKTELRKGSHGFCQWCERCDQGWYFMCRESGCPIFNLHIKCAVESSTKLEDLDDVVAGEDLDRLFDEHADFLPTNLKTCRV